MRSNAKFENRNVLVLAEVCGQLDHTLLPEVPGEGILEKRNQVSIVALWSYHFVYLLVVCSIALDFFEISNQAQNDSIFLFRRNVLLCQRGDLQRDPS